MDHPIYWMKTPVYTHPINWNDFCTTSSFIIDSEDECFAAANIVAITSKTRTRKRQKRQRSVWIKPWLTQRNELGVGNTLLEEFRLENDEE